MLFIALLHCQETIVAGGPGSLQGDSGHLVTEVTLLVPPAIWPAGRDRLTLPKEAALPDAVLPNS